VAQRIRRPSQQAHVISRVGHRYKRKPHRRGDDPYFIRQMAAWIKQNRVVYHIYWDDTSGYNSKLSDGHQPAAGAAFIRLFSPGMGS